MAVAFAPILDVHAEDGFNCLLAGGEGVIAHAREADLVGRGPTRRRSTNAIVGIANLGEESEGPRGFITGQASAQQTVKLMFVAVTSGVEVAHQAVLLQVTIVLPFTADAGAVRRKRSLTRMGSSYLSAVAHKRWHGRCDTGRLIAVQLLVAATGDAASARISGTAESDLTGRGAAIGINHHQLERRSSGGTRGVSDRFGIGSTCNRPARAGRGDDSPLINSHACRAAQLVIGPGTGRERTRNRQ